jgi:dephospho-CoA kinase
MLRIGLTGSIASGKSEITKQLVQAGIPVFDSDAEVHKLHANDKIISSITKLFPTSVFDNGIDRKRLGKIVMSDPAELEKLENLIHPKVREAREKFIAHWQEKKAPFVVFDIPLLYETGENENLDHVVVVSAPEHIRRERAFRRPGMTAEKLAGIAARQISDLEKQQRADFVIDNSGSLQQLHEQVDALIVKFKTMAKV